MAALCSTHSSTAWTASSDETTQLFLPTSPASWINSVPISTQFLKGKAAVFYFYEEGSPRCEGRWPELLAIVNKLADKPVVLIAVNSGNERRTVQKYAVEHRITMPIIVDSDRSFEKQLGVDEVNLQNIWTAAILHADGRISRGNADDLDTAANRALKNARWNVDPQGIPVTMRGAWKAIEFGNFEGGATKVRMGLKSRKQEVKRAAELLRNYVGGVIDKRVAVAREAYDQGNKFDAFQLYSAIRTDFRKFELPMDAFKTMKDLYGDATVKKELEAQKRLSSAKRTLSFPSPASRKRGRQLLESLVETYPGTRAGREAQSILDKWEQPRGTRRG